MRALVFDLKQVRRYLLDDDLRTAARERVQEQIGPDTHVLIGHSLGSVIAYEALCAMPGHPVKALVTLGSPLGMRMVFDRLLPPSW
ncbi:alpha/beta hydrolase [Streptomyces sp. NPDC057557]|uniref:alpha/beta hydrolase n=1 Tax=Streptomyces sp. NPDC057557 TaxID=3346167 RepID=UPI0036CD7BCA